MSTITRGSCAATTSRRRGEERVRGAAEHLYEVECALHNARQSGVDAWIAAAYDHLHSVVVEYEAALAEQGNSRVRCRSGSGRRGRGADRHRRH